MGQLNRDLNYILKGKSVRNVGTTPNFLGGFEMIAPTEKSHKLKRLIRSYKVPVW